MLAISFLGLIASWFLEYFHLEGVTITQITVYNLSGRPISLWVILILVFALLAIIFAPYLNKFIIAFLLLFWVLAIIGVISISIFPLANALTLAIIVVVAFGLLTPE